MVHECYLLIWMLRGFAVGQPEVMVYSDLRLSAIINSIPPVSDLSQLKQYIYAVSLVKIDHA